MSLTLTAAAADKAQKPEDLLKAARQAEAAGDSLNAFFLYGKGAALQPQNSVFALQGQIVGSRLLQSATATAGLDLTRDPYATMANRIAVEQLSPSDLLGGDDALPPVRLKPSDERKSFDLRGTVVPILEQVTGAFGISVRPEQDLQSGGAITFHVENVTRDEAFRALEIATNTFLVAYREDAVLAFRDTQDKRTANVPVMATIIPIPERMNVQEAQEIASGVQQIMELRRIAVDAGRKVIFIRDQEYKVLAARRMIEDMLRYRPQVMIEVELLAYDKNSSLGVGLSLQNAASILSFEKTATLASLGRIATGWFGLGIADAGAFATLTRNSSQSSLRSQMVMLDGQQGQLHVGDRYPVITGLSGFGSTSVPTTQFQDLGLKLQVTPVVHGESELTLTIEADYNLLAGGSNNGIPIISGRKLSGTTRVKFGEWAVIAGLAKTESSASYSGIAGLSQIPGLGHIFRRDTISNNESEILVILKPRLLSEPASSHPVSGFWIGTETKPPSYF